MNLRIRKEKNFRLKMEEIKNFFESSRKNLKKISTKTKDENAQKELFEVCSTFYEVNENIPLNDSMQINDEVRFKIIEATTKIEEVGKNKNITVDLQSKKVISAIILKSAGIKHQFQAGTAAATN